MKLFVVRVLRRGTFRRKQVFVSVVKYVLKRISADQISIYRKVEEKTKLNDEYMIISLSTFKVFVLIELIFYYCKPVSTLHDC